MWRISNANPATTRDHDRGDDAERRADPERDGHRQRNSQHDPQSSSF